jgi:catechol 2,3-dioxygenase-like lactoylglutathione lyase family enzyme
MSMTEDQVTEVGVGRADMKLEVLVIPVSDVDRAKEFYARLGLRLGAGRTGEAFRLIQFTPPGYGSFVSFSDPEGNSWLLQEVTTRLPGRVDVAAGTTFASAADLASAMRRAEAAHGEHEKRIGTADPDWPGWYASYMVAEQAGTELPT